MCSNRKGKKWYLFYIWLEKELESISHVNFLCTIKFLTGVFLCSITSVDILKTTTVDKLPNDLEGMEASMQRLLSLIDDIYKYVDDVVVTELCSTQILHLLCSFVKSFTILIFLCRKDVCHKIIKSEGSYLILWLPFPSSHLKTLISSLMMVSR